MRIKLMKFVHNLQMKLKMKLNYKLLKENGQVYNLNYIQL